MENIKYSFLDYSQRGNYAVITNGTNLLYIQYNNDWDTFSISTVHKPSAKHGTGFQLVGEHDGVGRHNIIKVIANSWDKLPNWLRLSDKDYIPYKDIEEYKNYETRFWSDSKIVNIDNLDTFINNLCNSNFKYTNCNGYHNECNQKMIHYGINKGSFIYYCNKCNKEITKYDILDSKPNYSILITSLTLGELLENKDETIKRNAMSILKTLNK